MNAKALSYVLALGPTCLTQIVRAEVELPRANLTVRNPPSTARCVDEGVLRERVLAQLPVRPGTNQSLPPLQLDVTVQMTAAARSAVVRVSGGAGGVREIEAARCEGLTDALAVTIAMILDQRAEESRALDKVPVSGNASGAGTASPGGSDTEARGATTNQPTLTSSADFDSNAVEPAAVATASVPNATAGHPGATPAPVRNAEIPGGLAQTPAAPTATAVPAKPIPTPRKRPLAKARTNQPSQADPASVVAGGSTSPSHSDKDMRAWIGAGAGTSSSWHLELGGEYGTMGWAIQLGAFYQPTRQLAVGSGNLELTTLGAVIAGCKRFGGDFRFAPCARATLGRESVDGQGFDQTTPTKLLVVGLGPSLGVETGQTWILGLDLIGQFGLPRSTYEVQNVVEDRSITRKAPLFVGWLVARVAFSSGT